MTNISCTITDICTGPNNNNINNNTIINIREMINSFDDDDENIANEMVALEIFFSENYTVKELQQIAGYYAISTRKLKKKELVQYIVEFEMDKSNYDMVSRRKMMYFYYEELKSDPFFKEYVI